MFLEFCHALLVVHGPGANSSYPKCLAIGDARFAMGWMAASLVKVLMGVCWLGIQICYQAVPITNNFRVKERDRLPGPLGGELDCWME